MFLGLQHVPSLGWTRAALQAGAKQLGYPPTSSSVVPHADIGLVLHQYKTSNQRLEQEMQKQVIMLWIRKWIIKIRDNSNFLLYARFELHLALYDVKDILTWKVVKSKSLRKSIFEFYIIQIISKYWLSYRSKRLELKISPSKWDLS